MPESFDPYRKWLGIPPAEQPPNHYRLLGVGLFEDDPDTIAGAADRQMGHVRTFQTGPHSALSQRLLNEISAARVCLLNAEKKSAYDARLRGEQAARQAPPSAVAAAPARPAPVAAPISAAPMAGAPFAARPLASAPSAPPAGPVLRTSPAARRRRSSPAPWIAAAAGLAIIVFGYLAFRPEETGDRAAPGGALATGSPTDKGESTGPATTESPKASTTPQPGAEPEAKLEILEASWGAGDRRHDITDIVRSQVRDARLVATVAGAFFGGAADPAPNAQKTVRIRYRGAKGEQTLEYADGDFVYLNGHPAGASSLSPGELEIVAARYGGATTWLDVLQRVRRLQHGNRLAVRTVGLAATDPLPAIRKALFVRYRTAEGEHVAHAWEGEELWLDARTFRTAGAAIDLLKQIDPKRDSVKQPWTLKDGVLAAPFAQGARLVLSKPPADDYLLTAVVEGNPRPASVGINLPVAGHAVGAALDSWGSTISGLQTVDGLGVDRNITGRRGNLFEIGQRNTIVCAVRGRNIWVARDGRVVADWQGDPGRLVLGYEAPRETSRLCLTCWDSAYCISKLEVAKLAPEPPKPALESPGAPVDLLKKIDPAFDAMAGDWKLNREGLISPVDVDARLQIPYAPPPDYELRVRASRREKSDAITVGLVVGGRQTALVVDGWGGKVSGLQLVDGKWADANSTRHDGVVFADQRPCELVITVHPNSVWVTNGRQTLVDWHGDPEQLAVEGGGTVPDALALFMHSWYSSFVISKLELRPLPPEPASARPDTPEKAPLEESKPAAQPAATQPAAEQPAATTAATVPAGTATDGRSPEPKGKLLAAAEKQAAALLAPRWQAAKTPVERREAVRSLYDTGRATQDDVPLRYALFDAACQRAAALGDAATACEACDELGREFQIDALAAKYEALDNSSHSAQEPSQRGTIALLALLLTDRAAAEEEFAVARNFASLAGKIGQHERRADLREQAERRLAMIKARQVQFQRFERASESLKEAPSDEAESLAAGRYLCLLRGDWQSGLPHLAAAGDTQLLEIVRLEPLVEKDPALRQQLSTAWLTAAERVSGVADKLYKELYQQQARYWYERAPQAAADGKQPKGVPRRLQGLPTINRARLLPGLDTALYDGGDFQQFRARRVDPWIFFGFGEGAPNPGVPGDYFSIRWTGWLRIPLSGEYVFRTSSDDSIRLSIDDRKLIDHWDRGAGDEVAEARLTEGLHNLVVEYNDYQGNAHVFLRWELNNVSGSWAVPPEAFFHNPAASSN